MGGEALPQAPRLSIPAASLAPSKARLDWCVRIGRVPMPSVGSGTGTTPNGGGEKNGFPSPDHAGEPWNAATVVGPAA